MSKIILGIIIGAGLVFSWAAMIEVEERKKITEYNKWRNRRRGQLAVSSRQHSKTVALIEYRLNQLEKKQDKHNQLIERMTLAEEKIKVANHRIEDLENKE